MSALTARAIGACDAALRRSVRASGLLPAVGISALCLLAGLPFINDIVRLLAGSRMGAAAIEYGAQWSRAVLREGRIPSPAIPRF